jgi:hypothetical protein
MILDLESDDPILDIKQVESSAESLYLLIHQRFVLSRQGYFNCNLTQMSIHGVKSLNNGFRMLSKILLWRLTINTLRNKRHSRNRLYFFN